ncbi:ABC transporter permease [uncultured Jatrophihabitans sp.]|uniref:ABC transporter permease n=1 Tax=uncultured Jatrophihabitans sp. TaxID=1610747 RepID=UPI0035CAE391
MTVRDASATVSSDVMTAPSRPPVRQHAALRMLLIAVLGMALLSLTRIISGADDITSAGALGATINAAMPIMLAGLGGLWAERSGVVNIGLEGQMILGTWFGAEFAFATHSAWMLVVGGIVGGFIGGVLHAIATVGFGVDQIVSGVAINILAPGVAKYLAGIYFNKPSALSAGGGPTQSPQVKTFGALKWTSAADQLDKIEQHHWFFVSDLAGLLEGICTSLNVLTIIALLTIPVTWFVLWRTSFGLRLRSCGENPDAAESLGVKVYTMKTIAVVISGILAGVAGAFLVNFTGIYREGQTGGRGYIGLAAMIFGNWRPVGLAAGSSLFGYTDALQQRQGSISVHALLIIVGVILILGGLYQAYRRAFVSAAVAVVFGAIVLVLYAVTDTIPSQFATYSPQIITLLVLAVASQRLRPPAADGLPWRRRGS